MNVPFFKSFVVCLFLSTSFQIHLNGADAPSLSRRSNEIIPTQTVLSSIPADGSVFSQPVVFTVKVVPTYVPGVLPSGFVQIYLDDEPLKKQTLVNNLATFTLSSIPASLKKMHHIKAVYLGDQTYASSGDILEFSVLPVNTKIDLATDATNPSSWGQSITLTTTVQASSPGTQTPQGKIQFYEDENLLKELSLDGEGGASLTFFPSDVGKHTISAHYVGDDNFRGSSANLTQQVDKAQTDTEINSSIDPSFYGQEIKITASIASQLKDKLPSGKVQFTVNGKKVMEPLTLDEKGQVKTAFSDLNVGKHKIEVIYFGDSKFNGSRSYLIQDVAKAPTQTSINASNNPSTYGSTVIFTAAVASDYAKPTGSVQFVVNERTLATKRLDSAGKATFSSSTIKAGDNNIVVNYLGDVSFNESSAHVTQQIKKGDTTAVITSANNPSVYGADIPFNVIVTSQAIPQGSIEFTLDGVKAAVGVLDSRGKSTFTTSNLQAGEHKAAIRFLESQNFNGSEASLTQQVKKGDVKITLSSSNNPSEEGTNVTFALTAKRVEGGGAPQGDVQFKINGVQAAKNPLDANGQSSYTTNTLEAGEHKINVNYFGGPNFNDSTAELSQKVNKTIKP